MPRWVLSSSVAMSASPDPRLCMFNLLPPMKHCPQPSWPCRCFALSLSPAAAWGLCLGMLMSGLRLGYPRAQALCLGTSLLALSIESSSAIASARSAVAVAIATARAAGVSATAAVSSGATVLHLSVPRPLGLVSAPNSPSPYHQWLQGFPAPYHAVAA